MDRRQFMTTCVSTAALLANTACAQETATLLTRGVVLLPEDLSLADWPERARRAGLTTIGIHHQSSPRVVIDWIAGDAGQRFLASCREEGLNVEYELHAMKELLPRSLFKQNPAYFRLNDLGQRTPDANCCVHSEEGLEFIAANAISIATALRPTTGRYFFWGDDGQPWCACPKCKALSPSDQALMVENRTLKALRTLDPEARLAHLAYLNTLAPPKNVKPAEGIFLEYAPINRRYDVAYKTQKGEDGLKLLEDNLQVFPRNSAQVLEYWLDVSRFSKWRRPAVKLPWNSKVFFADAINYRQLGIRHVTSFAAWIDADYLKRFGDLDFLNEYGRTLGVAIG